ncbi:GntR family transcriptional regulator [Pigmentiphaga litoralis]|uniref:GntR family transcriptional regulator n=1 Tax=Pigmentiphaga litoralis TaxID=516702 RepID=UPI001674E5CF|nr:GntR family transcriptional regulator [Pigmentiphaga litoralis]
MTAALALAARILTDLHDQRAEPGRPLRAQALADQWGLSRSPVNSALALLHARGLIAHAPGQGYAVGRPFMRHQGVDPDAHLSALLYQLDPSGAGTPPSLTDLCRAIADDRRAGVLPGTFSEAQLQSRYGLTRGRLAALLGLLQHDGWADRNAGQGWTFSSLLTSPDALLQATRSRMLLEPAALKEPGYRLAPDALARCREAEQRIVDRHASAQDLHERGVRFHQTLAAASRNRFLIDALNRIHRLRTALPHGAIQDPGRTRQQAAEHLAILDAIERGRLKNAATLLHRHLRAVHDALEHSLALTAVHKPLDSAMLQRKTVDMLSGTRQTVIDYPT